ncbi:prepilin [Salmonella enterica subsp. enterica serovar Saintpaul]|nr:prepilin [Salmonella enterica subsp. enterica serovar Saintpaul]
MWQPEFTDKTLSRKPGAVQCYLGQFDFCAIARMGNAEDAHYCQVVESPAGSRKWYKYEHKTGCIASCVTLN